MTDLSLDDLKLVIESLSLDDLKLIAKVEVLKATKTSLIKDY